MTALPTPSDAGSYNQRGAWSADEVYRKDQTGTTNPPMPDEVEYLGAYWYSTGYTEGVTPGVAYQGAYTGWALDTSTNAPTPNYNPAVPEAPTGLAAAYKSSSEVALFWNQAAVYGEGDVSSYNVYQNGQLIASTGSSSYTVKNLSASTAYSFTVSAVDQTGASGTETLITPTYNVNENPYPGANPTLVVKTPAAATNLNGKYLSPYIDVTLPSTNLESVAKGSALRDFTLAFQTTDTNEYTSGTDANGNTTWTLNKGAVPTISWGGLQGATATPTGAILQQVKDVEAEGGAVTISIGGYTGMDPAVAAAQYLSQLEASGDSAATATKLATANLQSEYQSILTTYGVHALDFDIENVNSVNNTVANNLRDRAINGLEANTNNAGLKVSFTVAVTPEGLANNPSNPASSDDYLVVDQAKKDGVALNTVNLMVMDYYDGTTNMLGAAEKAAAATEFQLGRLGLTSTKIGVTPMIGLNDDTSETFTLQDAKELAVWASNQSYIAGMGEWEIPRDQQESTVSTPSAGPQPTSSGVVETKNYEFASYLNLVTTTQSTSAGAMGADRLVQAAAAFNAGSGLATTSHGTLPSFSSAPMLAVSHAAIVMAA